MESLTWSHLEAARFQDIPHYTGARRRGEGRKDSGAWRESPAPSHGAPPRSRLRGRRGTTGGLALLLDHSVRRPSSRQLPLSRVRERLHRAGLSLASCPHRAHSLLLPLRDLTPVPPPAPPTPHRRLLSLFMCRDVESGCSVREDGLARGTVRCRAGCEALSPDRATPGKGCRGEGRDNAGGSREAKTNKEIKKLAKISLHKGIGAKLVARRSPGNGAGGVGGKGRDEAVLVVISQGSAAKPMLQVLTIHAPPLPAQSDVLNAETCRNSDVGIGVGVKHGRVEGVVCGHVEERRVGWAVGRDGVHLCQEVVWLGGVEHSRGEAWGRGTWAW
ncbi:hypothetical protein O3P69_006097 [Scylla paramamosain]|uniref:Uncharacterized protein n=1 Tax=Scylla paramamosain TaxID=85552 RepID=A0AAW0U4Z8_SCYPA